MATVADIRSAHQATIDAIWQAWRDLTRLHHSLRIAAVREADIWSSVSAHTEGSIRIHGHPAGTAVAYDVDLKDHLAALESFETLGGLVLVESLSLAEALARVGLQKDELGQIESWGPGLITRNYQSPTRVFGGLGGLVEAVVVRNAVAHALQSWTTAMVNRVSAVGGPTHRRGERFDLSDDALQRYRSSIRSLMRLSGLRPS